MVRQGQLLLHDHYNHSALPNRCRISHQLRQAASSDRIHPHADECTYFGLDKQLSSCTWDLEVAQCELFSNWSA